MVWLPGQEKSSMISLGRFDTIHECDGERDGTDGHRTTIRLVPRYA